MFQAGFISDAQKPTHTFHVEKKLQNLKRLRHYNAYILRFVRYFSISFEGSELRCLKKDEKNYGKSKRDTKKWNELMVGHEKLLQVNIFSPPPYFIQRLSSSFFTSSHRKRHSQFFFRKDITLNHSSWC